MIDENLRQHLLHGLERLSQSTEKLTERVGEAMVDISEIKTKLSQIDPAKIIALDVEVSNLKKNEEDREVRIRELETHQSKFSGKWGIIAVIAGIILSSFINLLFSNVKSEAKTRTTPEKPAITSIVPPK